jgi:hypothetical protein
MIDQRIEKGQRTTGADGRQKDQYRQGGRRDKSSQSFLTGDARDNAGWMFEQVSDSADEPCHEHVTFTENLFKYAILESGYYRAPLPFESRTYELPNVRPSATVQGITNLFRFDELNGHITSAGDQVATQPYREWDANEEPLPCRRRLLIEHLPTMICNATRHCQCSLKPLVAPGQSRQPQAFMLRA